MYGVLLAGERVVALAQPRAHPLHAHDVLLLTSFVLGSDSFRAAAESFSPICLPRFNPSAFLHAYVRFLDEVMTPCFRHAPVSRTLSRLTSYLAWPRAGTHNGALLLCTCMTSLSDLQQR